MPRLHTDRKALSLSLSWALDKSLEVFRCNRGGPIDVRPLKLSFVGVQAVCCDMYRYRQPLEDHTNVLRTFSSGHSKSRPLYKNRSLRRDEDGRVLVDHNEVLSDLIVIQDLM